MLRGRVSLRGLDRVGRAGDVEPALETTPEMEKAGLFAARTVAGHVHLRFVDLAPGAAADETPSQRRSRQREGCRRALVELVGSVAGTTPMATFKVVADERGVPRVEGREDLHVSVSHSAGLGLVAVSTQWPIGVDVEVRRGGDWLRVADRMLGRAAFRHLQSCAESVRAQAFLRLWTAGEACIKATGGAVARELLRQAADLSDAPLVRWTLPEELGGWQFVAEPLAAPEGFLASLCRRLPEGSRSER
jgi:phosphopantetheinyl transferase